MRTATHDDIPRAAATLAAAFHTYPWTRWSLPEDEYAARLERIQAVYLAHALEHGIVLVTDDLVGVIAVLPPDCPAPSAQVQSDVVALMGERLDAVFGVVLPDRLPGSWDLATLGVRPDSAGRGVGAALIAEALDRVRASASPRVSLETSSERNVALYARFGFEVTHVTRIPEGPTVHTMGADLGPSGG